MFDVQNKFQISGPMAAVSGMSLARREGELAGFVQEWGDVIMESINKW